MSMKQVEADKGGYHKNYAHDGADTSITAWVPVVNPRRE